MMIHVIRTIRKGLLFGRLVLFSVLVLVFMHAHGQAGTLDVTFDGNGIVIANLSSSGNVQSACHSIALQPDGKIVAVGDAQSNFAVARFNADGSLDPSFSGDGKAYAPMGPTGDIAMDVAIQPDGKIVVVGIVDTDDAIGLARFMPNGTLDTSFSGNGMTTVSDLGRANSCVLLPDGRILVAGGFGAVGAYVTRHLLNGELDTSFAAAGLLVVGSAYGPVQAMKVQADGRIVVLGRVGGMESYVRRYLPDGDLDTSFATSGEALLYDSDLGAMELQPDGKILIAGQEQMDESMAMVARFEQDGALDSSFGSAGELHITLMPTYYYTRWNDLVVQADGRIVLCGQASVNAGLSHYATTRLESDGSLDGSYGTGGWTFQAIGVEPNVDRAESIVLQPDGKVVVGGSAEMVQIAIAPWFGLLRYHADLTTNAPWEGTPTTAALQLWPDPVIGSTIRIALGDNSVPSRVSLFDSGGRTVSAEMRIAAITDELMELELPPLAAGNYVLKFWCNDVARHARFVVQ